MSEKVYWANEAQWDEFIESREMSAEELENYDNFVAEERIKEEHERRNQENAEDEQRTDNSESEGGVEVLSGTQPDITRGDEDVAGESEGVDGNGVESNDVAQEEAAELSEEDRQAIENMPIPMLKRQIKDTATTLFNVSQTSDQWQAENKDKIERAKLLLAYAKQELARKERLKKSNKWGVKVGNTATPFDVVRKMFGEFNSNEDIAQLFEKVAKVFETLPIKVVFSDTIGGKSTQGWFSPTTGTLKLPGYFVYGGGISEQNKAETILHEMIHAVTTYALYINEKPYLQTELGFRLSDDMHAAIRQLKRIYASIANDKDFKGEYGAVSVHEMIAELSNVQFREKLKKKGLWETIVDAIKQLFGITPSNALEGAEAALEYMLNNFDRSQWEKMVGMGEKRGKQMRIGVEKMGSSFEYFTGTLTDLISIAKNAVKGLFKKVIAPVSSRLKEDLATKGIVIDDEYNHVIDNNAIRHTLKKHSGKNEVKRGQIPVVDADFDKITDIVESYDIVEVLDGNTTAQRIIYQKSYSNGIVMFVEEQRAGRKELAAVTMWKKKNPTLTDANRTETTQISDLNEVSTDKGSDNIGDVQGLEDYSAEELKEIARGYIEDVIAESGEVMVDNQGNPIDENGKVIVETEDGKILPYDESEVEVVGETIESIGTTEPTMSDGSNEPNEVDDNGRPFIVSSNGTTTFGEITEDTGLPSAPIKLSVGYQDENGKGYGLAHIEANHGKQIRGAGFKSVEEFVGFVAENYDGNDIRVGNPRGDGNITYLIQVKDKYDNTLFIELSRDGSYWNVNSGGVFRKGYSDKKETVVKTEPQQPNNAVSPDSSLSEVGNEGISTTEPNGESPVSEGKDSENKSDMQEGGVNSPAIPVDEKGEPMYESAPVEATIADIYNDPDLDEEEADAFVQAKIDGATKRIAQLEKKKPKMGESKVAFKEEKAKWREQLEAEQASLAYWQGVQEARAKESTPSPLRGTPPKQGSGGELNATNGGVMSERKARAKGWFDTRTGKIVINISNHTSVADVERTLLHEAVAHYGLRQLFGKQFDTFLDNVYRSAEADIRAQIIELAKKHGWDFRTATEEYLAGLAEDTNFEYLEYQTSFWMKIKRFFMDMLESIGWDYKGPELSDNELRYLLWRSYENMVNPGRHRSILGKAEDVAKQYALGVGNYSADAETMSQVAESGEDRVDNQGNPIDENGKLIVEQVSSIDEITDADFDSPTRSIQLPSIPPKVDEAIGANGKPIVIKKNVFEKNKKSHKDLTPKDSRAILLNTLYSPDLYGQNQKITRPYNWILIHLADTNTAVLVEVNENKDNVEIINWHYINDDAIERKKKQAIREGGLILTLESAAADTSNFLPSADKVNNNNSEKQENNESNGSNESTNAERDSDEGYRVVTMADFHKRTAAVFVPTERPQREPDYISKKRDGEGVSSEYWYGEDENGEYVIRNSDHWSGVSQSGNGLFYPLIRALSSLYSPRARGYIRNLSHRNFIRTCYWVISKGDSGNISSYSPKVEEPICGKAYIKDFRDATEYLNKELKDWQIPLLVEDMEKRSETIAESGELYSDGDVPTSDEIVSNYIEQFSGAKDLDITIIDSEEAAIEYAMSLGDSLESAREGVEYVKERGIAGGFEPGTNKIRIFAINGTNNLYATLFHEHAHYAIEKLGGVTQMEALVEELKDLDAKLEHKLKTQYAESEVDEEIITVSLEAALYGNAIEDLKLALSSDARLQIEQILDIIGYEEGRDYKEEVERYELDPTSEEFRKRQTRTRRRIAERKQRREFLGTETWSQGLSEIYGSSGARGQSKEGLSGVVERNTRAEASQRRSRQEEVGDEGILFRDGDVTVDDLGERDRVIARDAYERMMSQGRYQFTEAMQDSMMGLKLLYKAILGKKMRVETVFYDTTFRPMIDAKRVKMKNRRRKFVGSLNTKMPIRAVPSAPMPVHIA